MRVLVTGADGFLGSNIVRHLLDAGYTVRAMVHTSKKIDTLAGLAVERVTGDVNDVDSVQSAIKGCEAVLHVASRYAFQPWWDRKAQQTYKVNVEGVKNTLEVAARSNIKRFIFTSSVSAIGKRSDGAPANEDAEFNLWRQSSHYARSKVLAEREVLKMCERGFPAVILNPAAIVGERDYKPTHTGDMIVQFLNRAIPAYFDALISVADVDDVAQAHVSALTKGRIGERYILSNSKPHTLKDFFLLLEKISGVPAPQRRISYPFLMAFVHIDELLSYAILRKRPLFTFRAAQFCHLSLTFDNSKAVEELGYKETPIDETLAKAVRWYRENGYVRS